MVKLNRGYSDYTDVTDNEYPLGKAIDSSSAESYDGTPILATLINDINASHIAMYEKAYGGTEGITGIPDTQKNSQFANAIAKYTDDMVEGHSNKTGVDVHGATVDATPNQIVCRDEDGRAKVASPIDDLDAVNKNFFNANYEKLQKILDPIFKTYLINLFLRPKSVIMTEDANFNPNTDWGVGVWEKLPDGVFVRNAGGDAREIGKVQAEGVPNIRGRDAIGWSGELGGVVSNGNLIEGAFIKDYKYLLPDWGYVQKSSGWENVGVGVSFLASSGELHGDRYENYVFGKSDHVTPVNVAVYYWRRVS